MTLVAIVGVPILAWFFLTGSDGTTAGRSATSTSSTKQQSLAGHQLMITRLKRIAERTPDENPWLGDRVARELRREHAALSEDWSDQKKWQHFINLAHEELILGNERRAIEYRAQAYQLLPRLKGQLPVDFAYCTIYRLGLAYMRLGETQNCCLRNTPESCLLPIQGGGVHTDQAGSRQAIKYLTVVLKNAPQESKKYLKARWLLNIAFMTIGGHPHDVPPAYLIPPEVFESEEPFPRFENIAARLKLNTFNLCGGAVVDDFDNDGYLDIVTSTFDTSGQIRFFKNNQDGTFSDWTERGNLTGLYGGLNLVQADFNNDDNVDVFVLRGAWLGQAGRHPNSLLRNNGDGTFTDVTFDAGLGKMYYPTQTAAWADYDNDGDLDLYVGNEHSLEVNVYFGTERSRGVNAPCQLFRNNGDGTFTDVAEQAGVENLRFAKGVVWGDYDNDRYPDLYVSNIAGPNRLYHNNRNGTFTDVAEKLGVTRPIDSFPTWFWDFDNDGVLDLYVSSYDGRTNVLADVAASYLGLPFDLELACLYRGDGQGGFEEVAREHNLVKLALPMGSNFGDLDNDGYLDFYLGTGYPDYEALMPNVMYHNQSGKRFADVTTAGGFGHLQKGHAIAFADFDHDGDQDIFAQMGGAYPGDKFGDALFRNPGFGNHWLTIRLVGVRSNRSAIGARIRIDVIEQGRRRTIFKHVNSGGSFGASPLRQNIGLGKASKIELLEIYWPTTNHTQTFRSVPMDQFIRIAEDDHQFTQVPLKKLKNF